MRHVIIPFLVLGWAGTGWTDARLEAVSVHRDVAYIDEPQADPDRHRLDVYTPGGEGPFPVLVWIHGGAWAIGHRRQEEPLARRLAGRGIAVVAIDHRMSKALWLNRERDEGVEHPAHIEDCAAAFAWAVAHCHEYGWDVDRLYVGGFSSGAHLAALLASDSRYLEAHDLDLDAIRGALPIGGAYDLEAYYRAHLERNGRKLADQHVLDVFGRQDGVLRNASPTTYVGQSRVPMLVISERDTFAYTKVFEDAMKDAKLDHVRFLYYPDRTHQSILTLMAGTEDDAQDEVIAFIDAFTP